MIKNLSKICALDSSKINIKATTTEWMGFVGQEKGISCYTVALIEKYK